MQRFLIHHRHDAYECAAAFAAWKGFASPLRRETTIASCLAGGHEIWWEVTASGEGAALAHVPPYVAERSEAIPVSDVRVP
jgi:hypothetical protein